MQPALQMLSYPALDDRTGDRTDVDPRRMRMVNGNRTRFAWNSYRSQAAGDTPSLAARARCKDLSGLPPAWLGVGTNDLFHDETVTYAERLQQAGVPTTLQVVPGAYHAFDLVQTNAGVSRAYRQAKVMALDEALNGGRQEMSTTD